ncbi:MAG: hypothetical protein ALECFALPRED_009261 [Alectoria fallacina]|uniref:Uncharacterized protein n=1 Tax=Alectoria fallacina TaxID=1903189 RepID=A0A8H3J740_9LECA|nr:MAG: hypothetical protein ALECFALPRED_009261 [Alectoria fallacina]
MSSFKTAFVIYLFLVLTSTASPIYSNTEIDSVPSKVFQTLHGSRSQFTTSNTSGKVCRSSDRSCKLHRRNHDFYIWRARPLELIFPTYHAGPLLQEFYHAILAQANEQWSLQAPLPRFWIKYGDLELLFDSVGGPIPWSVVTRFAQKMLWATQLGWFGTYIIIYQNCAANQAVGVTLRIANNQLSLPQRHMSKSRTVQTARRNDLKKRSDLHLTSFKIHGEIVPLSVAAPSVKAFFDAVAAEASNAWTSRPEPALLTITQGPFQLTVSCLGANIPWPLLVFAAERFSALADRFWVNTFDAFYEDSEDSITVAFSLQLLQEAAGPGLMAISLPMRRTLRNRSLPAKPITPLGTRSPSTPMPPSIKVTSFTQIAALVPSAIAAAKLEDFYTIIALKIETGQLKPHIPSKTIAWSLWDFELIFSCDKIDVPLSFVQAFVIDMAELSSRQFTGFYEATVRGEGALNGLIFYVQMRLKGKGQQSPYLE